MSRSSAKERSRVRIAGKLDTRRVPESFPRIRGLKTVSGLPRTRVMLGEKNTGRRNDPDAALWGAYRPTRGQEMNKLRRIVEEELAAIAEMQKERNEEAERRAAEAAEAAEDSDDRDSLPKLFLSPQAREVLRKAADDPKAMGFYPYW